MIEFFQRFGLLVTGDFAFITYCAMAAVAVLIILLVASSMFAIVTNIFRR